MATFTPNTAHAAAILPRRKFKQAYREAALIQRVLLEKITAEDVRLAEASQASRAWVELHDLQRRLLGLGDPKSVPASNDPTLEPKRRKPGSKPAETLPDSPE